MSFRKITVKSGNEEFTMNVTEEEYQRYYRPWWQQKKHEQRNREVMEQNGYTEESYAARTGLPIPGKLKAVLEQLREEKEN